MCSWEGMSICMCTVICVRIHECVWAYVCMASTCMGENMYTDFDEITKGPCYMFVVMKDWSCRSMCRYHSSTGLCKALLHGLAFTLYFQGKDLSRHHSPCPLASLRRFSNFSKVFLLRKLHQPCPIFFLHLATKGSRSHKLGLAASILRAMSS